MNEMVDPAKRNREGFKRLDRMDLLPISKGQEDWENYLKRVQVKIPTFTEDHLFGIMDQAAADEFVEVSVLERQTYYRLVKSPPQDETT